MSEKHDCGTLCVCFGWGFGVGRYEKQKTDQASAGQRGFNNFSTLIFSSTRGWGTQSLVLNTERGGCNEFSLANDYRQDVSRSVQSSIHFQPCMTDIYLHIDARMADYIRTHPYGGYSRGMATQPI